MELLRLKGILKDQIHWYKIMKKKEDNGEIDDSYIYDEAYNEFHSLSRGDYLEILEILSRD